MGKIILKSRSEVFKMMLERDMKEKEEGIIYIKDMNHDVLEDLMGYIYTGNAPNVDSHVKELFAAAHQYQVETLKEFCEAKICDSLDVTNCVELLVLGDLYQSPILKGRALKFVSMNMKKIEPSMWKTYLPAYPKLMVEVIEKLLPEDASDAAANKKK